MPTALEIFKALPRTNCGQCGFPTCLAFATALASGATSPERCPFFEVSRFPELASTREPHDQVLAILEHVRAEVARLDLSQVAPLVGGEMKEGWLCLSYLGEEVCLGREAVRVSSGLELDPRDQILLYNYLRFARGTPLSHHFVGLEAFPNSVAKVATLKRYAEDLLAQRFAGAPGVLKKALRALGARDWPEGQADISAILPALPRVPLVILFWDEDQEEGFSAQVKILFDQVALDYLDLESLVFLAERAAERLTGS